MMSIAARILSDVGVGKLAVASEPLPGEGAGESLEQALTLSGCWLKLTDACRSFQFCC